MSAVRCVLLCALVACVLGHGIITDPTPLNPNPTNSPPCGVDLTSTTYNPKAAGGLQPSVTWVAGSTVSVSWELIAGDGGTAINGYLATQGAAGGNPTWDQTLWTNFPTTQGTGKTYSPSFTVPDVSCSPTDLCILQVRANENNWVSCSVVNITCANCPPPPPAPKVCKPVNANTLTFCTNMNGQNVLVNANDNPVGLDQESYTAFSAYLNDSLVFENGQSQTCKLQYKAFLCALNLPPCPGSGQTTAVGAACHSQCVTTMKTCQLNPIHQALYDCSSLPLCPGESAASTLTLSVFAVVAVVAAMLF